MDTEQPGDRIDRPLLTPRHPTRTAVVTEAIASPPARLDLAMSLSREHASIDASRRLFDATLTALGVAEACRGEIELILTEASANAVVHAAGATYQVTMTVDHGWCILEVLDHGPGLRGPHPSRDERDGGPLNGIREGGRGMFLIRAFSDAAEWIRTQPQGLTVRMSKQLVWDTDRLDPSPVGDRSR